MKTVKTAVVGLGRIGWNFHIPAIMQHSGFELIAIADPLPDRISEGISEFSVHGYTDYLELLNNEKIDLMVIASPTLFHTEHAVTAMEKGVDVLLEKPIAPSLKDTDKILDTMKKTGQKLMVYQPHRATAETQAIKYIIDKGILGTIYMIKSTVARYTRRNDWQSQKKNGGGMLNNYGAHYIDQLLHITDSTAKKVSAHLRKIASLGDADDVVKILMETENNIILDLDINMACAQSLPKYVIMGQYGTAVLKLAEDNSEYFDIRYYREEELSDLQLNIDLAAPGRTYNNYDTIPWKNETVAVSDFQKINYYDKCYEYFAEGKTPYVPITETRELMRIIDLCHKTGW